MLFLHGKTNDRKSGRALLRIPALALALALVCALALCGCGKKTLTEFRDGSAIDGVDVSGMTASEAADAVRAAGENYSLSVTLDGRTFLLAAAQLGLTYNEQTDYDALLAQQAKDSSALALNVDSLFTTAGDTDVQSALVAAYTSAAVLGDAASSSSAASSASSDASASSASAAEVAADTAEADPTAAHIVYDANAGKFVGEDGQSGEKTDYSQAVSQITAAAAKLTASVTVSSQQVHSDGEKAAGSAAVTAAAAAANKYLAINLTYSFTPAGGKTSYETVSPATIASWLLVQADGLTVTLDTESMSSYCSDLASQHSSSSSTSQFKTTGGDIINVKVASAGQTVDADALYDDLYSCISGQVSGTREAPYSTNTETSSTVTFGGNYVEIDLTNQKVYCYKNYELVISTSCVSGSVSSGHATPTGVFTIKSKETSRYLIGPDYKSWVNYFMPFNGGIGLHDATWRSSFGGTYYLYNGSHGCINLPYSAAKTIFANVSVGTHVIVYGGASSVASKSQSWSGSDSYTVSVGSAPFQLGLTPSGSPAITYTSSDTGVCTVSDTGVVTPVGAGTCTITVKAAATAEYVASTKKATVTVGTVKQDQTLAGTGSYTVSVGDSFTLDTYASGGTALSYVSSDPSVAVVSGSGAVTAQAQGTCTITVTAAGTDNYNSASKNISVTVTPKAKADQTLSGTWSYTVPADGRSFPLDIASSGGTALSYVSSDSAVCTVSADGKVTVVGPGSCTITVTAAESDSYKSVTKAVSITVGS